MHRVFRTFPKYIHMWSSERALFGSPVFRQPSVREVTKLLDHFKSISFATSRADGFSVLCGSFSKYGRTKQGLKLDTCLSRCCRYVSSDSNARGFYATYHALATSSRQVAATECAQPFFASTCHIWDMFFFFPIPSMGREGQNSS